MYMSTYMYMYISLYMYMYMFAVACVNQATAMRDSQLYVRGLRMVLNISLPGALCL